MMMRPITATISIICFATFLTLGSAQAQIFSTYQITTTDTDVYNAGAGATALAWDIDDSNADTMTLVNGVTFSGSTNNTVSGVSLTISNLPQFTNNGVDSSQLASTATTNFVNVINGVAYNFGGNTGSLAFSGLTAGDTYELQLFSGSKYVSYSETLTDSTTISGPLPASPSGVLNIGYTYSPSAAEFIDEAFIAPTNGDETITLNSNSYIVASAINLQDTSVPEPSTYAMIFVSLGMLVLVLRFRGQLTA